MLLKILAILTAISNLVYGIGAYFVFPDFEKLFLEFGVDLPFLTNVVLVSYPYWLAVIIIPIGIYIRYLTKPELPKKVKNRILFVFVSMLLFSIVLLPLSVSLMYLPIFELEAANG
jgi:type II secretory pathway component PulF